MAKTLKQVTDERMAAMRPKIEAAYKEAAAKSGDLAEIEKLVDQIELQESADRLAELDKTLSLLNSEMTELVGLAVDKVHRLAASADLRVAEKIAAFLDVLLAHRQGLGKAEGWLADEFKQAQLDQLQESLDLLGPDLASVAEMIGKSHRAEPLAAELAAVLAMRQNYIN